MRKQFNLLGEWNSVSEFQSNPKFVLWNRVRKCNLYSKINDRLWQTKPFKLYKKFVPEFFDHIHIFASDRYLYIVSFPYGLSGDTSLLYFIANELGHEVIIHSETESWYSPTTNMITIKLGKRLEKTKYVNNIFVKVEDTVYKSVGSILDFLEQVESENFQINETKTDEVYKHYVKYCISKEIDFAPKIEFSKQINKILNMSVKVKRVGNKTCKYFVRKEQEGGD